MDKLLLGVFAPALGRHVGHRSLQDFQQGLLHPFAADVPGDGGVFTLAGDLVDLIDVDDATLGPLHIVIRSLDQLEEDVFHILAHISCLGEGSCIGDGKGHPQHLGQGLGQHGLAHAGGAQKKDVGFGQFHIIRFAVIDALIVVVHRHRKGHLSSVLPDDILVQDFFDLPGFGDADLRLFLSRPVFLPGSCTLIHQDAFAQLHALVADADPRAGDHPANLILGLSTEGAAQRFHFIIFCHRVPPYFFGRWTKLGAVVHCPQFPIYCSPCLTMTLSTKP